MTEAPATTRHRVVLCDDQHDFVRLLEIMLSIEQDIEIVGTADDGHSAIERCAELRPDVLLLDVSMPGMDGITALPAVLESSPGTCVLMLSGFSAPDVKQRALDAGATAFIEKGSPPHLLPQLIREHCA